MEAALCKEHLDFALLLVIVSDRTHAVDAGGHIECGHVDLFLLLFFHEYVVLSSSPMMVLMLVLMLMLMWLIHKSRLVMLHGLHWWLHLRLGIHLRLITAKFYELAV